MPRAGGALDYFERKMAFTTGPIELKRAIANDEVNVVDVRLEEDYRAGHIPGATNLPHDCWHTFEGLGKDRPNVLVCYSQVCHLAADGAVEFARAGYPVMELDGGWKEWQRHNLPIERGTMTKHLDEPNRPFLRGHDRRVDLPSVLPN